MAIFRTLLWSVLIFTVACGRNDSPENMTPMSPPIIEEAVHLQGNWKSKCIDPREAGLGETVRLQIQGDTFRRHFLISPHGDCSSPYIEGRIEGRLIFHPNRQTEEGKAVDVEARTATLKPLTDLAAKVMNLAGTCGYTDWKMNVEKEVYTRMGEVGCNERYPRTDYTIIATEKNEAGRNLLLFGAGERLTNPSRRPVRLDRSEQVFVLDGP